MKIIVVGCGKVGSALARQLSEEGHNVSVVDKNQQVVNEVSSSCDVLGIVEESTGRTPTLTETGEKREPGHGDSIDNGDRVGGRSALPHLVSIRQKNKFSVGETIEIMCPDGRDLQTRVLGMWNEDGEPVQNAPHPGELIHLQLYAQASPGDILRISR